MKFKKKERSSKKKSGSLGSEGRKKNRVAADAVDFERGQGLPFGGKHDKESQSSEAANPIQAQWPSEADGIAQSNELGNEPDNAQVLGQASAASGIRVSIIDVGKGDCILLQAGDSAALIDTGYENTSGKALSYLRGKGVNRLDFVIITHYDRDHIGGIRAFGQALEIGMVYLPAYEGADKQYKSLMTALSSLGLPTRRVTEVLPLKLGFASLNVYPSNVAYIPDAKGDEGNDNDLSLVSALTFGGDSFLFAADLEEDGLADYLRGKHGQFDVLKMPCHGKKSPYTDEFIDDVKPRVAIITDGGDDPAEAKTLKMLTKAGIETYRTSIDGTVAIEGNGAGSYMVMCSAGRTGTV